MIAFIQNLFQRRSRTPRVTSPELEAISFLAHVDDWAKRQAIHDDVVAKGWK